MNHNLLFVYGTLKKGRSNHNVLGDDAVFLGYASVSNVQLYDGPGFPYAFVTDDGAITHGELYGISDESFRDCDRLEGYPHHYNRVKILVVSNEHVDIMANAWIYVSPTKPYGDKIESGVWE